MAVILSTLPYPVPDSIQRCDICGAIYHSKLGGDTVGGGPPPHHFCGPCMSTDEYEKKLRHQLNPNNTKPV